MTIGIALLGAGIFAQNEHLPVIEAADLLELKAVYSRSQKTAESLLAKATNKASVEVYYDEPATEGRGLEALLAREDVQAVSVCIPIALQPVLVRKALAAGKHVISEKPVGATVSTARELLQEYRAIANKKPVWAVAENYRFQRPVETAETKLRELGGKVVSFELHGGRLVRPDGNYFNTPWRKVPTHPGGFLLDGGVHYLAALRSLLNAVEEGSGGGNEIQKIASFSEQLQEILPPVDSLRAIARTKNGASGVVNISFGTEFNLPLEATVTTTEGRVSWTPDAVTVLRRGGSVETVDFTDTSKYPASEKSGVRAEFVAFAQSIAAGGVVDPRQSPEEALLDLQVLEALLVSGSEGGKLQEIV